MQTTSMSTIPPHTAEVTTSTSLTATLFLLPMISATLLLKTTLTTQLSTPPMLMYLVTTTMMLLTMSTPAILNTDLLARMRMMRRSSKRRWLMSMMRRGPSMRNPVIKVGSRRVKKGMDGLRRMSMVVATNMVLTIMVTKRMRRRNTIVARTMMIKEALLR